MNNYLRLSLEGSMSTIIPSSFNPNNWERSSFSNAFNNLRATKKIHHKALIEIRDIFKFWYQDVFNHNQTKQSFKKTHQLLSPALGVALFRINKYTEVDLVYLRQLHEIFHFITDYHRFLYQKYDIGNEGLVYTKQKINNKVFIVQDPLFNSILTWSNECLIKIGQMLDEDLSEIMEWYELSIHCMNEKLWNEGTKQYDLYDLNSDKTIESTQFVGISPLMGGIPTQEQAEDMIHAISPDDLFMAAGNWMDAINLPRSKNLRDLVNLELLVQDSLLRYNLNDLYESISSNVCLGSHEG